MKKFKKSLIVICCLSAFCATGLPSYSSGGVFMKEKICGIYKITSPSKKIYIGQSVDIKKRKVVYARLACKDQPKLYNSLKKYGWYKHKFEIIQICDSFDLNKLEEYYVLLFNSTSPKNGLNARFGGGAHSGHTLETRNKMSEQKKIKSPWKGKKLSEEHKAKIGKSLKEVFASGERVPKNKGVKQTEETKNKISASLIGNQHLKGHVHTAETRLKMSKSHLKRQKK